MYPPHMGGYWKTIWKSCCVSPRHDLYANRALACILGFERPAAIIGRRFPEFLPPEKSNVLTEQYRIAMSTGINSALITTEVIRQDGTSAFIEIKPVTFITGGKLMGNQGVVRDITERK